MPCVEQRRTSTAAFKYRAYGHVRGTGPWLRYCTVADRISATGDAQGEERERRRNGQAASRPPTKWSVHPFLSPFCPFSDPLGLSPQPKEIRDIKQFIDIARRKDASGASPSLVLPPSHLIFLSSLTAARIKKIASRVPGGKTKTKFKIRCSRYLYTLSLDDPEKAEKLQQSLPPGPFPFPPPLTSSKSPILYAFRSQSRRGQGYAQKEVNSDLSETVRLLSLSRFRPSFTMAISQTSLPEDVCPIHDRHNLHARYCCIPSHLSRAALPGSCPMTHDHPHGPTLRSSAVCVWYAICLRRTS